MVVNYIVDPAAADEVAQEIEQNNTLANAITVKADVSKEDQVQEMFRVAKQHFVTVDILVNNAGLQRDAAFEDMTLEQ